MVSPQSGREVEVTSSPTPWHGAAASANGETECWNEWSMREGTYSNNTYMYVDRTSTVYILVYIIILDEGGGGGGYPYHHTIHRSQYNYEL